MSLGNRRDDLPIEVPQHSDGRRSRSGVAVQEVIAVGGERDIVSRILRSEQLLPFPIEANAVEVTEIWVATFFLADAEEVDGAVLFIDLQHLRYVAVTAGALVLQLARGKIVEVKLAPVVALTEPDGLVGAEEPVVVDLAVARFVLGGDLF